MVRRGIEALCGLIGLAAILVAGCDRQSAGDVQSIKPVVRVVRVQSREVTDYAFYNGRTAAVDSVDVKARVDGYLEVRANRPLRKRQRARLPDASAAFQFVWLVYLVVKASTNRGKVRPGASSVRRSGTGVDCFRAYRSNSA